MQVIKGAGHHVYADNCEEFNSLVLKACESLDVDSMYQPHTITDKKSSSEEEQVHQRQVDLSQTPVGVLQATETIENP